MTDWTVVLTAFSTSAVTGLLGYYGARTQSKVGVRAVEAENERLRLEHEEGWLRDRRDCYQKLLDLLEGHEAMMIGFGPKLTEDNYDRWDMDFRAARNTVRLMAPATVDTALDEVAHVLWKAGETFAGAGVQGRFAENMEAAFEPHRAECSSKVDALAAAMNADITRRDIGARSTPT